MTLRDWLSSGEIEERPATREEIARLAALAERDLSDAQVEGVSLDRRFAAAYEAALSLAAVALRAAGYRIRGSSPGHHWLTFAALPEVMGDQVRGRADYYQSCRRKRHQATYERISVVSQAELDDLLAAAKAFRGEVLQWLASNHLELLPGEAEH